MSTTPIDSASLPGMWVLLAAYGIEAKNRRSHLTAACPFHKVDPQALIVNVSANTWKCTACKIEGGPIEFIARAEGISRRHAVEFLRTHDLAPNSLTPRRRPAKHASTPKFDILIEPGHSDGEALDRVVSHYVAGLTKNAHVLALLHEQGIDDVLIEQHSLGFCDRTLGYRLPLKNRKPGALIRDQLTHLGVLRETGHETFRGRITVPIRDTGGQVTQILGYPASRDVDSTVLGLGGEPAADVPRTLRALLTGAPDELPDPKPTARAVIKESDDVHVQPAVASVPGPIIAPAPEPRIEAPASIAIEQTDREIKFRFDDRTWRIRDLERNLGFNRLKVTLFVSRENSERFHVDSVELYIARQRAAFAKQAATELFAEEAAIKTDLGKILLQLEQLQDAQIRAALEAKKMAIVLTPEEQEAALELLRDPRLLERVTEDFARCGVVGEETNKLVGYIAAVSRQLDQPLGIVIQSSSAAGKSSLMDAVLAFIPEEERIAFAALTGQSIFYMGEADLAHRILAIAEEQGASDAMYALKLLQSQGELSIASTGKDKATGRLVTQQYRVRGPVAMFMTTTSVDVDEELMNRCIVLTVDEGREQTRAIHALQRQKHTLEALIAAQERKRILALHQNAQRLLESLHVVNPFAARLTFSDHQTRTRRDHMKYLTLIRAIALLFQHQRDIRETHVAGEALRYIEVTERDIEIANKLAHAVLGRSLDDLPPQTRKLLTATHELLTVECELQGVALSEFRFHRRWLRERLGFGDTQLKVHLKRLVELEFVLAHRSRDRGGLEYELLYDGQGRDGSRFVAGLIEPEPVGA